MSPSVRGIPSVGDWWCVSTIEVRNRDLAIVESREMVELGMSLQLMESPSSVQNGCSLKSEYSGGGELS